MRTSTPSVVVWLALSASAGALARAQHDDASNRTPTRVAGIRVGHHTLTGRPTGCTVVVVDGGAVAGVAQRGAAPGTRETDLINPLNTLELVNAIALSGGSAYGLDVANGVVRWLEEHPSGPAPRASRRGLGGRDTRPVEAVGVVRPFVPIVPSAVLIDLQVGGRPD